MQEKKEMTTKLRPSFADSVPPLAGPRGQMRGWEITTAQRAGFITQRHIHEEGKGSRLDRIEKQSNETL